MISKRTNRYYTVEFKVKEALAAFTKRQPLAALVARYQLAPAQITRLKLKLCQRAALVFAETPASAAPVTDVEPLYAVISQLQMGNALLKNTLEPYR